MEQSPREEDDAMMCAWSPKDREWCRGTSDQWAGFALDIIDSVNSGNILGFGFHVDILSEPFLRCALSAHIDDDHLVDMCVECCKAVGFDGPLGAGSVLSCQIEKGRHMGNAAASVIICGLPIEALEADRKDWESWASGRIAKVSIAWQPGSSLYAVKSDMYPAQSEGMIDKQQAVALIARLMKGDEHMTESRIFYKFSAETAPWPWAKRKQLGAVLATLSKAVPAVQWDKKEGVLLLPSMGPQMRPEVGNVHVTLALHDRELVWGSAMSTRITADQNRTDSNESVRVEIVTTW
jgi:hypothetical protein